MESQTIVLLTWYYQLNQYLINTDQYELIELISFDLNINPGWTVMNVMNTIILNNNSINISNS